MPELDKNKALPIINAGLVPLACWAQRDADWKRVEPVLIHATRVMALLKEHGPSIVPHLLDSDDNEGEYLRQALIQLGICSCP